MAVVAWLKSPLGQALAALGCLLLAFFLVYHWGRLNGEAIWETRYNSLVFETAENKRIAVETQERELARQKAENEEIVAELSKQLKDAENRQLPVRVVIKEVTKYVTAKADNACPIPAGFEWVYNSSLSVPTAAGLASSKPRDVDAPTGITLSGVAEVSASNNLECVQRGEVIDTWQKWYLKHQKIFERMHLVAPQP